MATLEQQSHTLNERLTTNQADFQRQTEARYTTLAASVDRSLQTSLAELEQAMDWAKAQDRTTVISIVSDAYTWTPGDALWDVGVRDVQMPATPERVWRAVQQARK